MVKYSQKILSGIVGSLSSMPAPKFILHPVVRKFIKAYNIDMSQFDCDLNSLKCFDDFFVRGISETTRPIAQSNVVSPVDSLVYSVGEVNDDTILQIKGQPISVSALLDNVKHTAKHYACMYLSPADYHRFHSPVDMIIENIKHIPGFTYSVRPEIAKQIPVFIKNERVVVEMSTSMGKMWMAIIAAQNVGKIEMIACDNKCPRGRKVSIVENLTQTKFGKGDELGRFHLGSSIVLLSENVSFNVNVDDKLMMGQSIT